jgi:AcrR family transcriptional regulator
MLGEAMVAALEGTGPDPSARLAAIGQAYVIFALTHAGHFRVMFRGEATRTWAEGQTASSERTFDLLVQIIQECQRAGTAPPGDLQPLVLAAWAVVHGMATLWLDGSLPKTQLDPARLVPLVTILLSQMFAALADQAKAAASR